MFDCITGLAWWQPLMLASCKWLWQWVPSHQRQKVQGVGNINALLLFDLSCDLLNESDWNSMFSNVSNVNQL